MIELHQLVGVSPELTGAAQQIVRTLLGEQSVTEFLLAEATVHLPKRSRIFQAVFTGPEGGQVWRSTGLTDREQALLVAKKWNGKPAPNGPN